MWNEEYIRHQIPPHMNHSKFGVAANIVSLLDTRTSTNFERAIIKFPDRLLPAARVFGSADQHTIPFHLRECKASFTAGFSEPVPGLMFTPDHAFVIEGEGGSLDLISESCWHSRLFYNKHVRCDKSTNWEWRFNKTWEVSETIEEEVYLIDHQFRYQYFHWIMECLPRIWLMKNYMPRMPKIALGSTFGNFQAACLSLYGLDYQQCLRLQPNRVIRFKRAIIPAFEFVEPLRTRRPGFESGVWNIGWSKEFLDDLRGRAHQTYNKGFDHKLRIYVSRSDAEHRKLINEAELLEFLAEEGFTVVTPGEHSFARQVELFAQASVIVGVHGAGLTNLVWAAPGCSVIELAPDGLHDVGYRFSSQLCGHQFATILCRTFEHPKGLAYSDIEVDLDAVRLAFRELSLSVRSLASGSTNSGVVTLGTGVAAQVFSAAEEAYATGDLEKALTLATEYCARRPTNYWGHFLRGKIYRDRGDTHLLEQALRAAIATPGSETTHGSERIGAYFELLRLRIKNQDFLDVALLDEALVLSEDTEQKRWYYAGLHFLKALVALSSEDVETAETHLCIAYNFRRTIREREFLFDWVVEKLAQIHADIDRPYLSYLKAIAEIADERVLYAEELAKLRGAVFALEIGAMDGVQFDDLRQFLVTRPWQAILVEPIQRAYERLVNNYKSTPNIRCVRVAISDKNGSAIMYRVREDAIGSHAVGEWAHGVSSLTVHQDLAYLKEHLEEEEVETIVFADFIDREGIDRIDVLQIDTEGHDFIIFWQVDLEKFNISVIHIEIINLDPKDRLEILSTLREHGYRYSFDGVNVTATKRR